MVHWPQIYGKHTSQCLNLTEVMRQKDDQPYAELLNHVRVGCQTADDMSTLKKCQITNIESFKMSDVPHFFAQRTV